MTLQVVKTLAEHEARIEKAIEGGMRAFLAVGRELRDIQADQSYREHSPTFEEYVRGRWQFGRSRAYQFIDAATLYDRLSTNGGQTLPNSERQLRPLLALPAGEDQHAAWRTACELAGDGPVRTRHVQTAVRQITADASSDKLAKRSAPEGSHGDRHDTGDGATGDEWVPVEGDLAIEGSRTPLLLIRCGPEKT